ncbi:hypothetical protein BC831DRAFT_512728 [Entophlyctis helioformis]|nr:hypothetical protein BC831DRAFT_512728 [Entophlyctis helioformis]
MDCHRSMTEICTPTVIATLLGRFQYAMPFFGSFFHILLWIACLVFVASLGMTVFVPPKFTDKDDDEEHRHLISNARTAGRA